MLQSCFKKVIVSSGVSKQLFSWQRTQALAPHTVHNFQQKKHSLTAAVLVCLSASISACSQTDPTWITNLEEARRLCASGELDKSHAIVQKVQAENKNGHCPPAYVVGGQTGRMTITYTGELAALSDCYAFHGQFKEALALVNDASNRAKTDPQNANPLALARARASIYERQKQYVLAEPLRLSIVADPHANLEDSYRLGDVYLAQKKLNLAQSTYAKALAIEEKQEVKSALMQDHLNSLGRCYFQMGKYDQAEKFYKRALDFNPLAHESERGDGFNAKDLRPIADLYYAQGDLPKAEAFYRQSLSGAVDYTPQEQVDILNRYAKVLRQMNQVSEAEMREEQARRKMTESGGFIASYQPRSFE